jgi:hypothetical protein
MYTIVMARPLRILLLRNLTGGDRASAINAAITSQVSGRRSRYTTYTTRAAENTIIVARTSVIVATRIAASRLRLHGQMSSLAAVDRRASLRPFGMQIPRVFGCCSDATVLGVVMSVVPRALWSCACGRGFPVTVLDKTPASRTRRASGVEC